MTDRYKEYLQKHTKCDGVICSSKVTNAVSKSSSKFIHGVNKCV